MGSVPLHSHPPAGYPTRLSHFPNTAMLAIRIDHEGHGDLPARSRTLMMSENLPATDVVRTEIDEFLQSFAFQFRKVVP
jgi:hypothetical protein